MQSIYNAIEAFVGWYWGIPILIILIGGGIALTAIIGGVQFRRLGFIFKHTLGTIFNKEEQARKKAAGITPLETAIVALGGTVGTGNIVGVGAAIAAGGPGALFWMWVCGFLAMAIKYCEVVASVAYRQKVEDGSYRSGPYMYIKDGLRSKPLAAIFGVLMLVTISIICSVHASAITSNLAAIGVSHYITCGILSVFVVLIIFGGMKELVKITNVMVPFMCVFYIICALIVVFANIGSIGAVFASIFKGAFTGQAAIGGFAGAAVSATIRNGLARGVFSNDAGLGASATMQSQAESIDHPAQQGMWAVMETFIDTIVICTLTGLLILFSGSWTAGGDGSTFSAAALGSVLGVVGQYGCTISLVLFGLSSLVGVVETVKVQAISMFRKEKIGAMFQWLVFALVIAGCLSNISSIFLFVDFANGFVLLINIGSLCLLGKTLRRLSREWFGNNGDLAAIARSRAER